MGYTLGPKSLALALYGATNGNSELAQFVWSQVQHREFESWDEAWEAIASLLESE